MMERDIRYAGEYLKYTVIRDADALLLIDDRLSIPVVGLGHVLNSEDLTVVVFHKDELPARKTEGVVFLRPFADTAEKYNAPYGIDTVYAVAPKKKGKAGVYKLPAPTNR